MSHDPVLDMVHAVLLFKVAPGEAVGVEFTSETPESVLDTDKVLSSRNLLSVKLVTKSSDIAVSNAVSQLFLSSFEKQHRQNVLK
jgi:hypothetical protein